MNMRLPKILALYASLLTACMAGTAEQGLSLRKATVEGMNNGRRSTSTFYMTSTRVREASSNGSDFVLHLDSARFVTLDHNAQTYTELAFEEMQARIADAKKEAAESPEAEAQATVREQFRPVGELKAEDLGDGGLIAGYSTRHHRITLQPFTLEVWMAPGFDTPDVYYESLKLRASANPFFDLDRIYESLKEIKGVSLRSILTIEAMGLKIQTTSEVTEAVEGPLPASLFEVPANYERKSLADRQE